MHDVTAPTAVGEHGRGVTAFVLDEYLSAAECHVAVRALADPLVCPTADPHIPATIHTSYFVILRIPFQELFISDCTDRCLR